MAFDPRYFPNMLVVDTCSVWNMLSSRSLSSAAFSSKRIFCITPMVVYECLYKKRKITPEADEMIGRLMVARGNGSFPVQECSLEDLVQVSNMAPSRLSSGELSCIAMAHKISTVAVMTDERLARSFAEKKLSLVVETTPRLYGWLHFHQLLSDSDHQNVINEHERYEKRPLTKFFNDTYEMALQYRLMDK